MVQTVSADEFAANSWLSHAAESYAGGTGTVADPYLIETAEQLAKLALDSYNGNFQKADSYACFKLMDNIDLSAYTWYPIGCELGNNEVFCGYFDGNGKTISGLKVDISDSGDAKYGGFFGSIRGFSGAGKVGISDLTIVNATVIGKAQTDYPISNSGILVGSCTSAGTEVTINNVTVSGTVSNEISSVYGEYGGLIGYAYDISITNCTVDQVSISNTNIAGGLLGLASNVYVYNCQTKNINIHDIGGVCGGFIGTSSYETENNQFIDCSASGSVSGSGTCGGFVGYSAGSSASNEAHFNNCMADVEVSVNGTNAWGTGGFVGYSIYGEYKQCISYGDVSGNTDVGGFVGLAYSSGYYTNCASYGNVTSTIDSHPYIGGFVGRLSGAEFTYCHALGTVSSPADDDEMGGFLGYYWGSGNVRHTCSFAQDKNPTLSGTGEATGVHITANGFSTAEVLANICVDVLGGHQLTFHPEVPATETSTGVKAYYSCSVCGNVFDENMNLTTAEALGIPQIQPEPDEEEEDAPIIDTTPPDFILNAGGVEEVSVSDENSGIVDENGAMTVTIDHKTLSDLVIYRRDGYLIHGWTAEAYIPREVLKELYVNHTSCDIVLEFTPVDNPAGTSRPAYQIDLYCLKNGVKTSIELTTGEISVWLPYTIAPGEDSASLTVVTFDADGKVQHLENASYEDGKMTFAIRKSGVYGVGYAE